MTSHRATYNFEDFSAEEFDLVRRVLISLSEVIDDVQDRTMLIGAQARDLIHRLLGNPGHFLRTSMDVDLAVAVRVEAGRLGRPKHRSPVQGRR